MESSQPRDCLELKNKAATNAKKWAMMLADPSQHLVRAPSISPFLASKAKFVRALEIPYASTDAGSFSVTMLPDPNLCLAQQGAPTNIPVAAGQCIAQSIDPSSTTDGFEFSQGLYSVQDGNGNSLGAVSLAIYNIGGTVFSGLLVNITNGSSLVVRAVPSSVRNSTYMGLLGITAAGAGVVLASSINMANTSTLYSGNVPQALSALVLQCMNATGGTRVPVPPASGKFAMTFGSAQFPVGDGASSYSLLSSDVIGVGNVSHVRATAMSMLVTNMAAPINAGGELVMARTRQGILSQAPGNLMTAIKNLPEQLYWRSGNITEGGYAWYLPDQIESYEPRPINDPPPSDNVLIAAGQMSDEDGYVRVICTWVFEFYTPVQLFTRDNNLTWSEHHKEVFSLLLGRPACAGNATHLALIQGVFALASAAYAFYKQHEQVIDKAVEKGFKIAQQATKKKKPTPPSRNGQPPKKKG